MNKNLIIDDNNSYYEYQITSDIQQLDITINTKKPVFLKFYSQTNKNINKICFQSENIILIQEIILDNVSINDIHFNCIINDISYLLAIGIKSMTFASQTEISFFAKYFLQHRYRISSQIISIEINKNDKNLNETFFKIVSKDNLFIRLDQVDELNKEPLYNNFNMNNNREMFCIELYKKDIDLTVKNINANYLSFFPYIIFKDCKINLSVDKYFSCLVFENCIVNLSTINNEIITEFDLIFLDYYSYNNFNNKSLVKDLLLKFDTEQLSFFKQRHPQDIFYFIFLKIITLEIKLFDLFKMMGIIIIFGSFIFNQFDMQPKDPITGQNYLLNNINLNHSELNIESNQGWSYIEGYIKFNSFFYALDIAIPFLNLGQEDAWIPIFDDSRKIINLFYYFYKIITKILSFCLLFGFIKRLDFRYEQKNKQ